MMIDEHGNYVLQPFLRGRDRMTLAQACAIRAEAQKIVPGIQLYGEDSGGTTHYALAVGAPSGYTQVNCPN